MGFNNNNDVGMSMAVPAAVVVVVSIAGVVEDAAEVGVAVWVVGVGGGDGGVDDVGGVAIKLVVVTVAAAAAVDVVAAVVVVVVVCGQLPSPGKQSVPPTHALPSLFVGTITL